MNAFKYGPKKSLNRFVLIELKAKQQNQKMEPVDVAQAWLYAGIVFCFLIMTSGPACDTFR